MFPTEHLADLRKFVVAVGLVRIVLVDGGVPHKLAVDVRVLHDVLDEAVHGVLVGTHCRHQFLRHVREAHLD